jgi:hypothetical protein
MGQKIHIIGGGTFSHVRNHMALAAPAFGSTARMIYGQVYRALETEYFTTTPTVPGEDVVERHQAGQTYANDRVVLHLTKMAAPRQSNLVTNEDVAALIGTLIADPDTRVIILNAAICDYSGSVLDDGDGLGEGETRSGSHAPRLKTAGGQVRMLLTPTDKLIGKIRQKRKDIFVVGFKTTTGETSDDQYKIALNALKRDSLNLVFANDTVTRNNMIVAPEETRYYETTEREEAITGLVKIVLARKNNTFTRSTVVEGNAVSFQTDARVPDNLRQVVNHLVNHGAYHVFRNATAGHFAVRLGEGRCLTSRRKTNYTVEGGVDLVEVEYDGSDKVIAYGAKPSVGGQSQRIIFDSYPDIDCIAHAHIEMRPDARDRDKIAMDMGQWGRECGSFQCGQAVSDLIPVAQGVRAVMIDNHGPNIVFSRDTPAEEIIDFIDANFDLARKTGGMVA